MSSQEPNIDLYTTQTPNGIKISITLEELGYVIDLEPVLSTAFVERAVTRAMDSEVT
jgi:hypothetical protein